MKNLVIVRGCPGSGKTELATSLVSTMFGLTEHGIKVGHASTDNYFIDETGKYNFDGSKLREAHDSTFKFVEYTLTTDKPEWFFVHNTFTQEWEFDRYLKLGEKLGYKVHSIIVENRHDGVNVHDVPYSKVKQMEERFEIKLTGRRSKSELVNIIQQLKNVEQTLDYHPEGNVWNHTGIIVGEMRKDGLDDIMLWCGLFHDLGKLETTVYNEKKERWTAYNHEKVSTDLLIQFKHIVPPHIQFDKLVWLVSNHMKPKFLDNMRAKKREKLMNHEWFDELSLFNYYDNMVRVHNDYGVDTIQQFKESFVNFLENHDLI